MPVVIQLEEGMNSKLTNVSSFLTIISDLVNTVCVLSGKKYY